MPRITYLSVPTLPHSWALDEWDVKAPGVYPGGTAKGRYLVRKNQQSLLAAGAPSREGRKLVLMSAAYHAWLASHVHRVQDFHLPINDEAHRDKPDAAA